MDAHKQTGSEAQTGPESEKDEKLPSPPSPALLPSMEGLGEGIRDTRLIARAIRNRWPIRDELRKKVVDRLESVLDKPDASAREIVAAGKGLITADMLNLQQEKRDTGENNISVVAHIRGEDIKAFAADVIAKRLALTGQPSLEQSGTGSQVGATPGESNPG